MSEIFNKVFLTAVFVLLCPALINAAEYHYKVSASRYIFAAISSPADATAIVFSTDQEESVSTTPALIDLDKSKIFRLSKLESSANASNAVWRKDGHHVLFDTLDGIVEVDTRNLDHSPKKLVPGMPYGIALSPDESKLAFWKFGKYSLQLVVRDVTTSAILGRWTLPDKYGSEPYGFEIAFQDENILYARTFDIMSRTPLKKFNLATGQVDTVERDCTALVATDSTIYYVANSKPAPVLKKIVREKTETIYSVTGYDDLRSAAGGKWIALAGKGKSAVLDTSSDQISAKSTCELMTVLSDGTPLYVRRTTLSSNPAICEHSR